jgi:hypothetical protein
MERADFFSFRVCFKACTGHVTLLEENELSLARASPFPAPPNLFIKPTPVKRLSSQTSPQATTMASKQGLLLALLVAAAGLTPAASSATAVEYCSKIP